MKNSKDHQEENAIMIAIALEEVLEGHYNF